MGYSRHDYGDYGAGLQGNGCYKSASRSQSRFCVEEEELYRITAKQKEGDVTKGAGLNRLAAKQRERE